MLELIDKKHTEAKVFSLGRFFIDRSDREIELAKAVIHRCIEEIDKQPTIEPEVRHGRWIVNKRNPDYADCTVCGLSEWLGANGSKDYAEMLLRSFKKFCPNCGARMDATDTNVGGKGGERRCRMK